MSDRPSTYFDISSQNSSVDPVQYLLECDLFLRPYEKALKSRKSRIREMESRLTQGRMSLTEFASGHEYFGLHFHDNQWIFREWAPNAAAIYLVGDLTGWLEREEFALSRINNEGIWEIRLPAESLKHKDLYRLSIHWPGGKGDRIPAYARRVVQDPVSLIFNAQIWRPLIPYQWRHDAFIRPSGPLFIYEVHVGMAQKEGRVGSYREFTENIIPRIAAAGYNALQLMAIPEHPYYGSFGYHVSNFFAASSRFGTPEELKELIDTAHGAGLMVIMDIVHSHAVRNEVEGLSRFDGTLHQYFHEGERGFHTAWDSRCFDYGKYQVLHFLLSNCRFWLDAYHIDGFRFDGVTSMLYHHHGLEKAFTSYDDYFGGDVDEDAITYLALANKVIHELRPDAVTIAEDISGMPGLAVPLSRGGVGFDYRFAMGISDYWIRLIKEMTDESWPMGNLWFELTNRRTEEKSISYAESHDQALVGDQSLFFRLAGAAIYGHMKCTDDNIIIDRAMALHKMIRFITLTTADSGYLNFMGNEFGHPDWIDFPREGNNWSYHYARRQWHLVDDPDLKFHFLAQFDRSMIDLVMDFQLLTHRKLHLMYEHHKDKIIAFKRAGLLFVFNFHPTSSYPDYRFEVPSGKYRMIFNSDAKEYGGHGRLISDQYHEALASDSQDKSSRHLHFLSLYLPTRTALVLQPVSDADRQRAR